MTVDLDGVPWQIEALGAPRGLHGPFYRIGHRDPLGEWHGLQGLQEVPEKGLRDLLDLQAMHNNRIRP